MVYALACARVTGFITSDRLTETWRNRLIRRWCRGAPADDCTSLRAYLIVCQWCTSIYVALPAAVLWYFVGDWPWVFIPAVALAFSQVTGMISDLGR